MDSYSARRTALFGKSTLVNAFVRDYQVSTGWSHAYGSNPLNEVHAAFSRDDQYSTPTGLVNAALPTVLPVPSGGDSGEGVLAHRAISTTMQFASGRPYAALLDVGALSNSVNNTAVLQSTPNSVLGINAHSPSRLPDRILSTGRGHSRSTSD